MSTEELTTDLLVRSRGQSLSIADEERLRAALDRSHELRTSLETLEELDGAAQVQPGDDELLERLVSNVLGPPLKVPARAQTTKPKVAALLVLGSMLGSAGLAAANGQLDTFLANVGRVVERVWSAEDDNAGASAAEEQRAPSRVRIGPQLEAAEISTETPAPVLSPSAEETPDEEAAPSATQQSPRQTMNKVSASAPPRARPTAESAAAVAFGRANTARRSGDWNGARELYEQIVEKYDGSSEASVSMLALGNLGLLEQKPASALKWFQRYQHSGGQMMAAEAMLGERKALAALGRHEQATGVTAALCRQYPGAHYPFCKAH